MSIQMLIDAAAKQAAFYIFQADACVVEAAAAQLPNVRDRALQSEAAWRELAVAATCRENGLKLDAANIKARDFLRF